MKNLILLAILLLSISCSSVKTGFEVKELINGEMVTVKEFSYKSSKDIVLAGFYDAKTRTVVFELKSLASPVIAAKGRAYEKGIKSSGDLLEHISKIFLATQGLPVFGAEVASETVIAVSKGNKNEKRVEGTVDVYALPEPIPDKQK